MTVPQAIEQLKLLPYQDLGFAKVDHHRALRRGFPEVVMGLGKSPEQVAQLVEALLQHSDRVLVTRAPPEAYTAVQGIASDATYHAEARAIVVDRAPKRRLRRGILVVTAGTADIPVAEEAAVTAELMGNGVQRLYDVGVSGIHRLLDHLNALRKARVIVAVAGMEGALPSVVAGLVEAPVIGVPTSVGYGSNLEGLAPLADHAQ